MNTELRESYFIGDAGALYFLGSDREIHKEDVSSVLSLYDTNREKFEKFITGINDGYIGMCSPGEYICVDVGAEEHTKFTHIPSLVFKRLIRDPDTIRLRHKLESVILLQYNPEAVII